MSIKEFGKRLKIAREEKEMSQRGLGLALGLSDKTISSYESSRSFPNLEVLMKISEILGKPVESLISSSKEVLLKESFLRVEKKQDEISKEIEIISSLITQGE